MGEDSPIPNTRGIRKGVVKAPRKIMIPVLGWPGGWFADEYHWKDGTGPRHRRLTMVNTHWGYVTANDGWGAWHSVEPEINPGPLCHQKMLHDATYLPEEVECRDCGRSPDVIPQASRKSRGPVTLSLCNLDP